MHDLRYYQKESVDNVYEHLRSQKNNPCIVLPTGAGKTAVMATICRDTVEKWGGRVLVVSHVKELIEQTASTLRAWFNSLDVGIYSAGLKSRDTSSDIIVASVQSVANRAFELVGDKPFNLVLVDKAHRIPLSGDGQYRKLLNDLKVCCPGIRLIGLTATPYRLNGGDVCGKDNLLNEICYEVGVKELIQKGYLSNLSNKCSTNSADIEGVKVRNGEYDSKGMAEAYDQEEKVNLACREIVDRTNDRNSIIIFGCNVEHAGHIKESLEKLGAGSVGIVTGSTPATERAATISDFKDRSIKYLVNVNVLTEGFDATGVDCVVLLRSTMSPGLLYQMVGRGLRVDSSKEDCLVLDFGGNISRHGPIDQLSAGRARGMGGGEPVTRTCPQCDEVQLASYSSCLGCQYIFPKAELLPNHDVESDSSPILSIREPKKVEITETSYSVHTKRDAADDAPKTLRVSYYSGLLISVEEWVCVEHSGFAGNKAKAWWDERCSIDMPKTAREAVSLGTRGFIAEPESVEITERIGNRFSEITKYNLGPIPEVEPDDFKNDYF